MKSQPVLAAAFLVFAATGVYAWASTYHNAPMAGPAGTAAALTTSASLAQGTIELVTPPRDFYGPQPHTFEWTGVKDADNYAMGIWNDADRMLFRADRIPGTSYSPPKDFELEAGTYFWTVTAVRDGQELASSGLSAFMVRTDQ